MVTSVKDSTDETGLGRFVENDILKDKGNIYDSSTEKSGTG
jgi:hypothetical protein